MADSMQAVAIRSVIASLTDAAMCGDWRDRGEIEIVARSRDRGQEIEIVARSRDRGQEIGSE